MKVLVACLNGMGSSQMIKMKVSKVLKKLGIEANVEHMSLGEAKTSARNYDAIFCSNALVENFNVDANSTKVLGLKNLLSEAEIEEAIRSNGLMKE